MSKTTYLKPLKSETPYEIEVYLDIETGKGGSCTVFLGKRNALDVIIKKMKSKDLLEVEQEQRRYNKLTNIERNHILVSFDIYQDNEGNLYKVQQVNDGKIWLNEHSPMGDSSLCDTLEITKSLLKVVSSYHNNDILLMDISPDNIFVQENENRVMLFDLDASVDINNLKFITFANSKMNFAPYEILDFKRNDIGPWSDLYMVANCLYYRLFSHSFDMTGDDGSSDTDIFLSNYDKLNYINLKNDGKFKDNAEVYSETQNLLIEFFKKAFRLNKRGRFQNAEEMDLAIGNIIYSIKHPHRIENIFQKTTDKTIGREKEVEAIRESFSTGYHMTVLTGTGGIGKTSIAHEYAEKYKSDYDSILQLSYSTSLINTINGVTISNSNSDDSEKSDEERYKKKLEFMQKLLSSSNSRTLLIIDNMNIESKKGNKKVKSKEITVEDKYNKLSDLNNLDCDILITSRNKFTQACQHPIEIDLIEDMETAIEIFRHYYTKEPRRITIDEENKILEKIIEKVGKLPLILRLLASAAQNSVSDLTDIKISLLNENFIYPIEEIAYDKDGNVITASVDEILEFIFDLNNLMDDEDNKNILRCMSLMPYTGIYTTDLKEMLGLNDLNKVNRLISISIIQENKTTGMVYLHQVISDLLRKKLKSNCTKCKKMFTYLKKVSTNDAIASFDEYNYIKNIFLFINDVFPNKCKRNKTYAYYELAVVKSMGIFDDFIAAKKHLQIIVDKKFDEYTVYTAYQYQLAISLDLRETETPKTLLAKFDSWDNFRKYDEIFIGVNDSKGWYFMFIPDESKEGCLRAIELFESVLNEFSMVDFNSDIEGKFLRMQYSLALAHYIVAKYYEDEDQIKHYKKAKEFIKIVIERRKNMTVNLHSKALHEYNLLAQCYGALGDVVKARDEQKNLIAEKLKYHSELTHTVAASYRNLVLSQNAIFQKDVESNYNYLISDLATLNSICKKIDLHEFNATYYDVWFQICIKTNNGQILYDKLKEFYEYISDNYENTNFYAKTYNAYSYKNITRYINEKGLSDHPLESEILNFYKKCNAFLS